MRIVFAGTHTALDYHRTIRAQSKVLLFRCQNSFMKTLYPAIYYLSSKSVPISVVQSTKKFLFLYLLSHDYLRSGAGAMQKNW